jgi:hypothetical protein
MRNNLVVTLILTLTLVAVGTSACVTVNCEVQSRALSKCTINQVYRRVKSGIRSRFGEAGEN